ncbi:hypothetical protein AEAC466_13590 [Asticcacaulis sp. AC466]|uniref:YcaO-like family protein n=1 Tax=Asticcacaulis sp. AC466 TaxID=1282362 RepID=UPI0003C3BEFA|nr:YcaO-like family protein [Asticcacaulis sp. AC466]ESQ83279.1 hypothetical protein AEAC466_13590 [Asticcacaulis sp. AC466]
MGLRHAIRGFSRELLGVIDQSLNPRQGLINSLVEEPLAPGEGSGLVLMHALVSPPTYYRGNAPTTLKTTERGTGAAFSRESACWAAIGEALERYAASIYWDDKIQFATANELGNTAINLRRLIHVGRAEVRLFNPGVRRGWVKGRDMVSSRPVLVPAALTFLGYARRDEEESIGQNDSTGLACGSSFEGASLSALCEVIERDVFASNWLLSRQAPRLLVTGAIERLDMPVQVALRNRRLNVRLYYLAQAFGVHVVASVVQNADGRGVVAAAASPFILRAVEKAVTEGLHSWTSGNRNAGKRKLNSAADITSTTDHLLYYLEPDRFQIVNRLFSSEETVSLVHLLSAERGHVTSGDIAAAMGQAGFSPAAVDLTTVDIANLNLHVVRVLAPGLQPLVFGPACTLAPDARRLNEWRTQWGVIGHDTNPDPHPFP